MIGGVLKLSTWSRLLSQETDASWPLKLGYIAIAIMTVMLGLWSFAMPLAESIIAPGTMSVSAQRRTIAHVEGGKIAAIHVKEGDRVGADQPLLTLDSSKASSELEVLRYQRHARQAKLDRLKAERDHRASIDFHETLLETAATAPQVAQLKDAETRQFLSRRQAVAAKEALLAERAKKAADQTQQLTLQLDSVDRQIAIVRTQAANAEGLFKKGFGTKSSMVAFQRELEQLITQRLQIRTKVNELDGVIEDSTLNNAINQTEFAREIEQEITVAQHELAELDEKIDIVRQRLANLVVKSSVEGIVVDLRVTSINDVVRPADPILDILPVDSSFMIEARIAPAEVDGVVAGLPVDVRFPAFATMQIPTITGQIASVSADVLADDRQERHYYKIMVALDNLSALSERGLDVLPGMPTDVIIKKRDRSLVEYVFAPLTNHLAKAVVD